MSLIKKNENQLVKSMLTDLAGIESLFNADFIPFKNLVSYIPAVNIKEEKRKFEIELAVPGFSKDDFKIKVDDNVLSISAEKKEQKEEKQENFTRQEFNYSSFERSFSLPQSIDEESIEADYKNGLLHLNVPKKESTLKKVKKEIAVK